MRARKLFDRKVAGKTPAIAAKRGGPGARARHGRPQGDKRHVQDMLVAGFGAGLEQDGMVVACHAIASSS